MKTPNIVYGAAKIKDAFCQLLKRCPESKALWDWSIFFEKNQANVAILVEAIAKTEEYYQKHVENNADAVVELYKTLLDRIPDPGKRSIFFINQFQISNIL